MEWNVSTRTQSVASKPALISTSSRLLRGSVAWFWVGGRHVPRGQCAADVRRRRSHSNAAGRAPVFRSRTVAAGADCSARARPSPEQHSAVPVPVVGRRAGRRGVAGSAEQAGERLSEPGAHGTDRPTGGRIVVAQLSRDQTALGT